MQLSRQRYSEYRVFVQVQDEQIWAHGHDGARTSKGH